MVHLLSWKDAEGHCNSFVLIVGSTDNLEDSYSSYCMCYYTHKSTEQKVTKYGSDDQKYFYE